MRASAIALFACSFAVVAPAFADTRIFSVETDRPGVTITAVSRNGQPLAASGTTGARSFFTIDAGSATVPCSNQLAFTASNGQRLEFVVDLCAHNWQVKLPLGAAPAPSTPPPPPPPTTPAPPPPPASLSSITIYTDTAGIGITEVFLDKQPVTIGARNANGVSVALPPGQAVKCERDLGLGLTDGRRIARTVNICQPNGVVVVALNGDGAAPPPVSGPIVPPPPPGSGPVPPPPPGGPMQPPAPPDGGPIIIDNLQWSFGGDANRASLAYALPQSDNVEFFASCNRGSRQIEISLERSSPETRPGATVPVTITAGTFARTYNATGSEVSALTGKSHPEFATNTDDQLWVELIRGDYLVIQTGSAPAFALSLRGSSAAAKPFLAACGQQAAPPPPPPGFPPGGPVGGQVGGDYSCAEEGTLTSQKTNIQSRLIFTNTLPQPVQLFWLDYNGRRQPYLTLAPGETGVQPTFFTHPWLVSDLGGRCVAIYFARRDDAEIMIGR